MNFFGDKATAQAAADFIDFSRKNGVDEDDRFKFLGNGASRVAFLHKPSQVIYKVQYWADDVDNQRELAASVRLRKYIWEAVYIPKMEAYETTRGTVLAVEYIDAPLGQATPRNGAKKGRLEMVVKGRFADMHGMNFLVLNDICIPIDMGHPSGDESTSVDQRCLTAGDGSWW